MTYFHAWRVFKQEEKKKWKHSSIMQKNSKFFSLMEMTPVQHSTTWLEPFWKESNFVLYHINSKNLTTYFLLPCGLKIKTCLRMSTRDEALLGLHTSEWCGCQKPQAPCQVCREHSVTAALCSGSQNQFWRLWIVTSTDWKQKDAQMQSSLWL